MDEIDGGFEWDHEKRQKALDAGRPDFADVERIDFSAAQTGPDLRKDYGEMRYLTTGYLDGRLVVVCWTPRNGRTRIISLRKANDREITRYQTRAGNT
jgi:uncharacterized DUF497 family protein